MKELDLGIIAWPRLPERIQYLDQVLTTMKRFLVWQDKIRFLVSAETDKVPRRLRGEIGLVCRRHGCDLVWHEGYPHIGANINNLFDNLDTDWFFLAEDDRECYKPCDLFTGVELLNRCNQEIAAYYGHKVAAISYSLHWNNAPASVSRNVGDEYQVCECAPIRKIPDKLAVILAEQEEKEFLVTCPRRSSTIIENVQVLMPRDFPHNWGRWPDEPIWQGCYDPDNTAYEMDARLTRLGAITLFTPNSYFRHIGKMKVIDRSKKYVDQEAQRFGLPVLPRITRRNDYTRPETRWEETE